MNLKNQLKHYLDKNDLTAAQLAKKAGISKQVISLWMNGGSPKNIQSVKAVADIFGVTVDHLCFGTDIKFTQTSNDNFDILPTDNWMSGLFEIKIRKIKQR